MCTVTLSYDEKNIAASEKLAALLSTGLFKPTIIDVEEASPEEVQVHRQLVEAFLNHSKSSMSHIIARSV